MYNFSRALYHFLSSDEFSNLEKLASKIQKYKTYSAKINLSVAQWSNLAAQKAYNSCVIYCK